MQEGAFIDEYILTKYTGAVYLKKDGYNNKRWVIAALLSQLYRENRDKFIHKVFKKKPPKPLMKYREIEIIMEILESLKPARALEWGAGYSTLYFPQIAGKETKWFSIEHNRDWAKRVREMNHNRNVEIFQVDPDKFPWTDEFKDGAYSDLKGYIEFADRFGKLDFIFIDGRARKEAVVKAYGIVKDEGIVVLHDANRTHYHKHFNSFKYQALFTDKRRSGGGIWVGSKGLDINKVLNVALHKRLWKVYNMFQRHKEGV